MNEVFSFSQIIPSFPNFQLLCPQPFTISSKAHYLFIQTNSSPKSSYQKLSSSDLVEYNSSIWHMQSTSTFTKTGPQLTSGERQEVSPGSYNVVVEPHCSLTCPLGMIISHHDLWEKQFVVNLKIDFNWKQIIYFGLQRHKFSGICQSMVEIFRYDFLIDFFIMPM